MECLRKEGALDLLFDLRFWSNKLWKSVTKLTQLKGKAAGTHNLMHQQQRKCGHPYFSFTSHNKPMRQLVLSLFNSRKPLKLRKAK